MVVVVAVWPRGRLERFVNTRIQHLAECLLAYRNISKGSRHLDDADHSCLAARRTGLSPGVRAGTTMPSP